MFLVFVSTINVGCVRKRGNIVTETFYEMMHANANKNNFVPGVSPL